MSADQFIVLRDGRHMPVRRVDCAVLMPDGNGWKIYVRGADVLPGEADLHAWPVRREQLIRAARGEVARSADGSMRRVLFWRVTQGRAVAEPVFEPSIG